MGVVKLIKNGVGVGYFASRVQYPVIVLRVARIEGSEELQVHPFRDPFLWNAILFIITINNWTSLEESRWALEVRMREGRSFEAEKSYFLLFWE